MKIILILFYFKFKKMEEKNSKKFKISSTNRSLSCTSFLIENELIRSRVIRGSDWRWKKQDGN